MTARRHQPPSRIRYAAEHPTIGVHVTRIVHQRLVALRERTGMSLGKLVLGALGEIELEVETAFARGRTAGFRAGKAAGHKEGYEAGFATAEKKYRLVAFCARCWNGIVLEADSELGQLAVGLVNGEAPHHDTCEQVWELTRRRPAP